MPEITIRKSPLKALDIKQEITKEFLFRLGYLGVFHESINSSDIFGIKRSLHTVEVEVKVSKSDLMAEIVAIQNNRERKCASTKRYKHDRYLGRGTYKWIYHVPNEYYLAVPTELLATALAGIVNTPYGVIGVGQYKGGYQNMHDFWGYHVVKRATKMHRNKLGLDIITGLIRKTSTENYFLREKANGFNKTKHI